MSQLQRPELRVVYAGLQTCVAQDLLAKSLDSEFSLPPGLSPESSLAELLEHFAYRAAPLNENAKPFDPERPFFDYATHVDLPEIEKDFREGRAERHLPVEHSHPYLEMFFDSDFRADGYQMQANLLQERAPRLERKPLRVEAIVKIQRALGVRQRSGLLFAQSVEILESFLGSVQTDLSREQVEVLEAEYRDFAGLCRDPNHLLKQDSLRSGLGRLTFERVDGFRRFTEKCRA